MLKLTKEQIHKIYQELDCGLLCFYNPENGEIKSLPDFDSNPYAEEEMWEEEIKEIESNSDKYIEFEKMSSRDSFIMMEDFVDEVKDETLKDLLAKGLSRPKPFHNFKFVIDNSGEFRDKWFEFKEKKCCEWIEEQIEGFSKAINDDD
jgi:hypothetical protein